MERRSNEVKRILVVDDDAAIRTQLRWALSGEYDVSLAVSPAEALQVAERERPDLVTLDLSLLGHPGEGEEGLEILPALKAMDPDDLVSIHNGAKEEAAVRAATSFTSRAAGRFVPPSACSTTISN